MIDVLADILLNYSIGMTIRRIHIMELDTTLDSFIKVLPYMKYFFDDDISIAVTDTEKFLCFFEDGSLRINGKPGTKIPDEGTSMLVLKTGEPSVKDVPAHVYGIPFRSYAIPVKDENNKIIGTVLLARSLELSNLVKELSVNTKNNATALLEHTGQVMERMQQLFDLNTNITKKADQIKEKSNNTKQILVTMQDIVKQSNLLGLNASIEAARYGASGRGFAVVANRIEELSKSTGTSINTVKKIIDDSMVPVDDISVEVSNSNHVFEEQTLALNQMNEIIHNIQNEIQKLVIEIQKL